MESIVPRIPLRTPAIRVMSWEHDKPAEKLRILRLTRTTTRIDPSWTTERSQVIPARNPLVPLYNLDRLLPAKCGFARATSVERES